MKIKILLAIIIYVLFPFFWRGAGGEAFSQNWLWAKSAGGAGQGYSVSTDISGNIFVTGAFYSSSITFGSTTLTNAGGFDLFIAKYDATGNVIWAKSAGGAASEGSRSISTDASGNVFVTGFFNSPTVAFGSTTLTIAGNANIFIAKYDTDGNALWAKSMGGTSNDRSYSISADAGGNVFITGGFDSPTVTFGSITLTNPGSDDIFIAKYDPTGNVLWAKRVGGASGSEQGYSVNADAIGNAFITGYFSSPTITFGSITLTNAGGGFADVFVVKYDGTTGNVIWAKSAGGTISDTGNSVSADAGGNVFVTGYFFSPTITFGSTTLTNANVGSFTYDVFIAKYDAAGNLLWAKSAGGTGNDIGYSVSTDAGGNVFVTGNFSSPTITFGSTTLTQPVGSIEPMFIVKYNAAGNVLCASVLADGGDNESGVSSDLLGNAYIGGDFKITPFILGSNTLTAVGGVRNIFVAKYTCCNSSSIIGTTTIVKGDTTSLIALGGISYLWNSGDTTSVIKVMPTLTTVYCVAVKTNDNCIDTTCITITIDTIELSCGEVFVPTAFSPNGDKQNDLECVFGNCIESLNFKIYNRWGEKVFETNDPKVCWDGMYQGKEMKAAVFTYYLNATLLDKQIVIKKGNITLIK